MAREPSRPGIVPFAVAALAGVLAWDLARLIGGRSEAWDDPSYWTIGLPLMLLTVFILGLAYPERPWRWALTGVGAQAAWALFLGHEMGDTGSLAPLGLLLFALLALGAVAAACVGGWISHRLAD